LVGHIERSIEGGLLQGHEFGFSINAEKCHGFRFQVVEVGLPRVFPYCRRYVARY
jgi:hypothetical protein